MPELTMVAVAVAFAALNGANDGGVLVAAGLKIPSIRPAAALAALAVALAAVPAVLGTAVASTLTDRLVSLQDQRGRVVLLAAIVGAVVVAALLARRGLPTSLTLAVVGGFVGAGLGGRLPVSWGTVGFVMAMGMAAPLAGAAGALAVSRAWSRLPPTAGAGRLIRNTHRVAFVLLCLAYGFNDGQKVLAVMAVTLGITAHAVATNAFLMVGLAAVFAWGALLGLPRYANGSGLAMLPVRPLHAVTAELSSALAVIGSAAVGAPVSMTQSMMGALVGSGMNEGRRRVRWQQAARVAAAWLFTLPLAVAAAAATAAGATAILT
ncbi:MAG: inorganic phosphate transporter [Actinomycetota bacterium]|nr:inorganic phosphate transporter [Actinomycetota bacterium]